MEQKNYNVIGVMSGTSLDGIDCALIKVSMSPQIAGEVYPVFNAQIINAETIAYPNDWVNKLRTAHTLSTEALSTLNASYTIYLAQVINTFKARYRIKQVDAVCSHGHTILHQPQDGFTLQIGNLPELAQLLSHKVVCDFRVQDVALGGQGAPLVPIGDKLLFGTYDYCLNLGGFANVSTDENGVRLAYDICPVNVVLNTYAHKLGKPFDDEGAFAKAGTIHAPLLKELNSLPYYGSPAPKSLGIEWVHEQVFPIIESYKVSDIDVLATFTEHIAVQIATQFKENTSVLVTGGGAYNSYLLGRVQAQYKANRVKGAVLNLVVPDAQLIEFKEALVFGLLGVLRLEELPNCLASVTGASQDHSSGMLYDS
ncbi:anhydro-N-acetylmuramic acid kinase [Dokdonia sp. LLG6352-1]|uniref:anhydro-N-acetylmuramic acid kinase n=1 Tax=Dokdonia sp. LLG6352-1 TaxID=3160831 RepID=UPI0038685C22